MAQRISECSGANVDKPTALLLPADGTTVRLVGYETKQRDDQDGTVDFGDYLPAEVSFETLRALSLRHLFWVVFPSVLMVAI